MADLCVVLAGEDALHRSIGHRLVSQVLAGIEVRFRGLRASDTDFFVAKDVRAELRSSLGTNRPLHLSAPELKGSCRAQEWSIIVRIAEVVVQRGSCLVILADGDSHGDLENEVSALQAWFSSQERKLSALVIGVAHPEAEAWVIVGLGADATLKGRRQRLREPLKFDPCTHPERLLSTARTAANDCKRVRARLSPERR